MSDEEAIVLRFEYTAGEVAAGQRLMARGNFRTGRFFLMLVVILTALLVMVVLRVIHGVLLAPPMVAAGAAEEGSFWWDTFPLVVVFVVVYVMLMGMIRSSSKEYVKELPGVVAEIGEKGIRWETPVTVTEYKWEAFRWLRENEKVLALSLNSRLAVIVPKRAMSGEELVRVRGLMQAKVGRVKGFPVEMGGKG